MENCMEIQTRLRDCSRKLVVKHNECEIDFKDIEIKLTLLVLEVWLHVIATNLEEVVIE